MDNEKDSILDEFMKEYIDEKDEVKVNGHDENFDIDCCDDCMRTILVDNGGDVFREDEKKCSDCDDWQEIGNSNWCSSSSRRCCNCACYCDEDDQDSNNNCNCNCNCDEDDENFEDICNCDDGSENIQDNCHCDNGNQDSDDDCDCDCDLDFGEDDSDRKSVV